MENKYNSFRIVADSAADLFTLNNVPFSSAPLKIITDEKEFCDNKDINIAEMVDYLKTYKGKSTSSCPNPDEWLKAFGNSKYIFAVAITSGLSGSFNAAMAAKEIYETEHPDRRVFVIDSLSAGPGEAILVEKLEELILSGKDFDTISKEIIKYQEKTGLIFILQSLTNFANNGRISPAVAKIAGLLGICIVGKASDQGTLQPLDKCRGLRKSIDTILENLIANGFNGGKIRIAHCFNESGANELKTKILEKFNTANIKIYSTQGLCSFYAEKGGILIGYETV
ncbi:MAG: DegV family protein [Clostridia bacterium]|nr:DegV family protein [Clostridia bacterium]